MRDAISDKVRRGGAWSDDDDGKGGEDKARVAAAGDDGRDCGVDVRAVLPRSGTPDFNYWPSSLGYVLRR